MRKFLLPILFISSLLPKDIIAVLELEQKGLTKQEAEILTDRLTTKLVSIGKYQVVERNNMDMILQEQKFQKSGCTDSECAVEIGQLLNTDLIVIGSVSKFGTTWVLDARLINVGQGNVLISAEFTMTGAIDGLITTGITSVARQLCELEDIPTTKVDNTTQNTSTYVSGQSTYQENKYIGKKHSKRGKHLFQFGLFSHNGAQLFSLSRDIYSRDNFTINGVLGWGHPTLGIGYILHPKGKEKSGFNYAITIGVPEIIISPTLLYQKNISGHHYYIIGVVGYYIFYPTNLSTETGVSPILSYCYRF